MTHISTLADPEAVAVRAAREIAAQLARALQAHGVAQLALSGGTTPARTYELLADALPDWRGVEVWFADERCVAPTDAQSNYRMARETLLTRIAIDPGQIHRMEGERGPHDGATRYAQALRAGLAPHGGMPEFDTIVLGVGPDGHVASLFPRAATLGAGGGSSSSDNDYDYDNENANANEVCLAVSDSPKPPPQRITLSLAVLRAARHCVLLATGASKRAAIGGTLGEPTRDVPASLLRRERLTLILDDAASPSPPDG